MYACGFRIYFTPLPGFFSPFPHGTGSLSVDHEYLALEDGPPIFRQDFTCPALLVVHLVLSYCFRLQGYHLLWPHFPERSANNTNKEYRLFPFRSPLLWESRLISFPAVT
ncbi:putative serine acetyltransferase [Burkholderia pseudomallei]|nr:putative serine acetyltransferase [Burkholderia mallei]KGD54992.1 putative serine acetyltransferase [Burkholderia pseudomallei]KOS70314.1 putative serine acetyltransferase [Burkholderia mallei]KOS84318.1 putative serine acetyltransferase [Burkholderia mallei]KOS96184.1 putative serine acetyltransferase [Burkholderia mallei]